MKKTGLVILTLELIAVATVHAQAPTGTMAGRITDPTGAVIPGAHILVTNKQTGAQRALVATTEGDYSAPALLPGIYEVAAEAPGFQGLVREAIIEAGTTTTVNLTMQLGATTDTVTVDAASPQMHYDTHEVGGVVTRSQIEGLPLNGRNFLELAKLEPGVTMPGRSTNNRSTVPILGAGRSGLLTRVTVDGGNISQVGVPGPVMGLSQEAVQEFQIATTNSEVAAGSSGSGLVNIVTRSGTNEFHGGAFLFFRDHHLAAYPGLIRDPLNPDPFFQRRQWGGQLGGPIRRDRAFFFANFETNDQRGVISVQPRATDFASLGGIFPNPYLGRQANGRIDVRLNENHSGFVRYSHDGNVSFAPNLTQTNLPSNWNRLPNWVDQSMAVLTSVLTSRLTNDLRFSYFFASVPEQPPRPGDCPGNCIGLGAPRITIPDAGVTLGNARISSAVARRYQISEGLSWQKGPHRMRFGFEWEHGVVSVFGIDNEPATLTLYSPEQVRQYNAGVSPPQQIPLPSSFKTLDDILQLPLQSFVTDVGSGRPMQPGFSKLRRFDSYRLYGEDVWRVRPRLTFNYGLGWSYEPHNLNYDLTRPAYLAPFLGTRLDPPPARATNFAPSAGFAWMVTSDSKTVVRGGAGLYYEPQMPGITILTPERKALGPLGTGRYSFPGSGITYDGAPLYFPNGPTRRFTAAQLLAILPGIRANLALGINPDNRNLSVRNIEANKQGEDIFSPDFTTQYAIHTNVGIQREIARDFVISADYVRRRFVHVQMVGIDFNHYNAASGPLLPKCADAQKSDPKALCSLGPITFNASAGRMTYNGLLLRVERRFSHGLQFLGSYALSTNVGTNGGGSFLGTGFNLYNWFENYGPMDTDRRHVLSISGVVELPKGLQLSSSALYYSKPPFSVVVSNMDFNGDGIQDDLLPGTKVNQFNRGLGKSDLERLVNEFNERLAGTKSLGGQTIPRLTLPPHYDFNSSFFTLDQRISRTWAVHERWKVMLIGEAFNLFNVANLSGYGNRLPSSAFGQPSSRVDQVFGSGGPRAFQLGARVSF